MVYAHAIKGPLEVTQRIEFSSKNQGMFLPWQCCWAFGLGFELLNCCQPGSSRLAVYQDVDVLMQIGCSNNGLQQFDIQDSVKQHVVQQLQLQLAISCLRCDHASFGRHVMPSAMQSKLCCVELCVAAPYGQCGSRCTIMRSRTSCRVLFGLRLRGVTRTCWWGGRDDEAVQACGCI